MSESKQKKCSRLYEEYKELENKTRMIIQDFKDGKFDDKEIPHLDPEDMLRSEAIRRELLDCKDCLELSPDEWWEIERG